MSDYPSKKTMTPQDWFGLAVRICALYPLVNGVESLVNYLIVRFGGHSQGIAWGRFDEITSITLLTSGIGNIAVSLVLLRIFPLLVTFTYPPRTGDRVRAPAK